VRAITFGAIATVALTPPEPLAAQTGESTTKPPATPRQIYSVRDVVGWSMDGALEALRERPEGNQPEPTVVTRGQALATARQVANRRSSLPIRAVLDTITWAPDRLRRVSAYAAMRGGDGALAFLLAAERRKPGDWSTQYNIAMHLLLEGYPRAALAILDSLRAPEGMRGPGGVDLRAALLLGRGNAMLRQGRARAAIPLLREARQREPAMAEAARSLAQAHLMLGEEEQAKRALFLARRFATTAQMEAVAKMIDPARPIDDTVIIEAIEDGHPLRLNARWPFRKGFSVPLRILEPPSEPEGVKPFLQELKRSLTKLEAQFASATAKVQVVAQAYATDTVSWAFDGLRWRLHADVNLPWGLVPASFAFACAVAEGAESTGETFDQAGANRAAEERFEEERIQNPQLAGYTRSLRRASASACTRLAPRFWMESYALLSRLELGCPSGDGYRPCVCKARREVAGLQLTAVNAALQDYHRAAKQWFRVAHDQSTSTAGYVEPKDRTLLDMVQAEIDVHRAMTVAGVHQNMQLQYQVIIDMCVPERQVPTDSTLQPFEPPGFDPVEQACAAGDGMGIKQDLVVAEVKFGCYEIELEAKTPFPGLKGIGSATYAIGGEKAGNITLFFGFGVGTPEIPNFDMGAKAGSYITFTDKGTFVDGGLKASADVTVNRVVKEVSAETTADELLGLPGAATYVSKEILMLLSP
jgi:tetratricopeptide (TPR) repeat protein